MNSITLRIVCLSVQVDNLRSEIEPFTTPGKQSKATCARFQNAGN